LSALLLLGIDTSQFELTRFFYEQMK